MLERWEVVLQVTTGVEEAPRPVLEHTRSMIWVYDCPVLKRIDDKVDYQSIANSEADQNVVELLKILDVKKRLKETPAGFDVEESGRKHLREGFAFVARHSRKSAWLFAANLALTADSGDWRDEEEDVRAAVQRRDGVLQVP